MSIFYTDTITRKRPTLTKDSYGEKIASAPVEITFEGSFQAKSGNRDWSDNLLASRFSHRVYCDIIEDIVDTDVINFDSKDYRIVFIDNNLDHHWEIDLEEIS